MENREARPTPEQASAALADAEASRSLLAANLTLPSATLASIGLAIAIQIALTAVGLAQSRLLLVGIGAALFLLTAAVQLARFRRRNGVWLGGFVGRVVLGTSTVASVSYALTLAAAIWAAYEDAWGLVALAAVAGGLAYALSGRRWLRTYRAQPAVHGRGESLAWLVLITLVAIVGLVLLVIGR